MKAVEAKYLSLATRVEGTFEAAVRGDRCESQEIVFPLLRPGEQVNVSP